MTAGDRRGPMRPTGLDLEQLDGAIAELWSGDRLVGWVAVRTESFRNIALAPWHCCWLLFTWSDGSIDMDEDYAPWVLVPELVGGAFTDDDGVTHRVVWLAGDHRGRLWEQHGIHHSPGYYFGEMHRRRD